jgi:uncharacterized protein YjiS (DUF1127 family)
MRSTVSPTVLALSALPLHAATARGTIVALWRRYHRWRSDRIAATWLHAMDDRMLKDIGLCRGEIDFVLRGVKDPTRVPRGRASECMSAGELRGSQLIDHTSTDRWTRRRAAPGI